MEKAGFGTDIASLLLQPILEGALLIFTDHVDDCSDGLTGPELAGLTGSAAFGAFHGSTKSARVSGAPTGRAGPAARDRPSLQLNARTLPTVQGSHSHNTVTCS
jgi:hypothetical protein